MGRGRVKQKGQVQAKRQMVQLYWWQRVCEAALGQCRVSQGRQSPGAGQSQDSTSSGWGRARRQSCLHKCRWTEGHQERVKYY